jgi:hypothetical protein
MHALHSHFVAEWKPGHPARRFDALGCALSGQFLPNYCALQHIHGYLTAKFRVTFCLPVG